jgi:hypothetical protein
VAEVEELVGLAFKRSPIVGTAVLVLLAAVAATPVMSVRLTEPPLRAAAWGLAACFALWSVAPFLGAFPVPFAGIGMSAIVGGWLGVGLLAALARARPVGRFG